MRARFKDGFNLFDPVEIILLISLENERQSGEKLEAFFDLVGRLNNDNRKIECINILNSDYLNRHYIGNKAALELGANWDDKNKSTIDNARSKNIKIREEYWKETTGDDPWKDLGIFSEKLPDKNELILEECDNLMNSKLDEFQKILLKMIKLYGSEEEFNVIVNNLARSHAYKSDINSAKRYVLEECAVISTKQGRFCYPADQFNAALVFIVDHFSLPIIYHSYSLYKFQPKKRQCQQNEIDVINILKNKYPSDLFCAFQDINSKMNTYGILEKREKIAAFKKFLFFSEQQNSAPGGSLSNQDGRTYGKTIN